MLVEALTMETTQVWALPEGGFQAEISAAQQRFRQNGDWVDIDLTLHRRSDGTIAAMAHPNDLRITAARSGAEQADLASFLVDGERLGMSWAGALPEPTLDGPRATYAEALPGVDLVVEATQTGFEQFLIVKSREAVAAVQQIRLGITGVGIASQTLDSQGALTLRNRSGHEIARVPTPEMWDSSHQAGDGRPQRTRQIPPSMAARSVRADASAGSDLVLTPDIAWMLDPQTVFPVVIDPVLSPAPSVTFDTYVWEQDTSANSTNNDLWLGLISGKRSRSFVHWSTAALVGKQITASTVSFYSFWSQVCDPKSWEIWPTGPASESTLWDSQPAWYDADPTTPGDQPAATSTETIGGTPCGDGWSTIDGVRFFQYAADHAWTIAPMGLRATNEYDSDVFRQYRSINNTATSIHPKAVVTYNSYPKISSRATNPATVCVTGTGRPAIQTMTPTLSATVGDDDGSTTSVAFEWWAVGASAPIGSATVTGIASGATASVTVPKGQLDQGGRYQWRVTVSDGMANTVAAWCEFATYVTVPPVDGCERGAAGDFNGDGVRDTVVGDPKAMYNGQYNVGAVYIVDGASGAVTPLRQGSAGVPDTPEAEDGFGASVAVFDANRDGCADLAIGSPFEDVGAVVDAGSAMIVYGAPGGLGTGPATLLVAQGASLGEGRGATPDTPEAYDWFGHAITAGLTAQGEPYLIIGAPGEDVGTAVDAGIVHYLRGTINIAFDQATVGVGAAELDDRTGFALASTPDAFAVAQPGEKLGDGTEFAGSVCVFSHVFTGSLPTVQRCVSQDATGVSDTAESGDLFGMSVAMVPYRPAGTAAGSLLVVGAPGEDV
ncbi:MAG: VCBS repeat-containing protein, partial [Micromonosporaceae bacterium]|nr:VCBS repeat-containing protein [Micromonosporaceae bacterium]